MRDQPADRRDLRCAIYTRKSVDPDMGQEFNSLESQRSICASYIASQRPNGWAEISKHYDDAGESGASLLRPALQDLLSDVENGQIRVSTFGCAGLLPFPQAPGQFLESF